MSEAREIIERLGLAPHPEGGWFREAWREPSPTGGRALATGIHFLLESDQRSHWHRVDAAEMWLFHAGDPLRLLGADGDDGDRGMPDVILGPDVAAGQAPQHLFPAGRWQAAEPTGGFALVSCVVAPGFEFSGFELAPPGVETGLFALNLTVGFRTLRSYLRCDTPEGASEP